MAGRMSPWYVAGGGSHDRTDRTTGEGAGTANGSQPRVVNPRTQETFVLLRIEQYERLKEEEYDDSPWTREELEALSWERVKDEDWSQSGPPLLVPEGFPIDD